MKIDDITFQVLWSLLPKEFLDLCDAFIHQLEILIIVHIRMYYIYLRMYVYVCVHLYVCHQNDQFGKKICIEISNKNIMFLQMENVLYFHLFTFMYYQQGWVCSFERLDGPKAKPYLHNFHSDNVFSFGKLYFLYKIKTLTTPKYYITHFQNIWLFE